jgi:hypothetical protein
MINARKGFTLPAQNDDGGAQKDGIKKRSCRMGTFFY